MIFTPSNKYLSLVLCLALGSGFASLATSCNRGDFNTEYKRFYSANQGVAISYPSNWEHKVEEEQVVKFAPENGGHNSIFGPHISMEIITGTENIDAQARSIDRMVELVKNKLQRAHVKIVTDEKPPINGMRAGHLRGEVTIEGQPFIIETVILPIRENFLDLYYVCSAKDFDEHLSVFQNMVKSISYSEPQTKINNK